MPLAPRKSQRTWTRLKAFGVWQVIISVQSPSLPTSEVFVLIFDAMHSL